MRLHRLKKMEEERMKEAAGDNLDKEAKIKRKKCASWHVSASSCCSRGCFVCFAFCLEQRTLSRDARTLT